MLAELNMQYFGQIFWIHLRHKKAILLRIFTKFDRKVDFQIHLFGGIRIENRFFKIK